LTYKVTIEKAALKTLKKMDKFQSRMIYDWIINNLEGCENPRIHGKGLVENHSGEWRYRIGDYRVLAVIDDGNIKISVIRIGHRKDVYKGMSL